MRVLGIETTCDETSCAVVVDGKEILSNVIRSQIALHTEFGGVVPELACRQHIDAICPVLKEALQFANLTLSDIDLIAVAKGPGLIGALLIGIMFAKTLAWAKSIPIVGVNHIEAHLYAAIMSQKKPPVFPALGIVLSGGHTSLVHIDDVGEYRLIGETIDDAIGEAFDKTAKILGLGYPGGPLIEALSKNGDPNAFQFTAGKVKTNPFAFSFSGIKTSVLYTVKKQQNLTEKIQCDIAASFQKAVFLDVLAKLQKAIKQQNYQSIYLGGGVTQNKTLRTTLQNALPIELCWPETSLCLDNAAMIAGLGYHEYMRNGTESDAIAPETRIPFSKLT